MESEGNEDESLEKSQGSGLLQESGSKPSKTSSSRVSVPDRRPGGQLWLHAALMSGRDFLYAVEVVLVTPIMLQLGMSVDVYSYIWFCSPTLGLLLGPIFGSWSDRCTLKWGRRRPFVLGFVIGTVIGLTLLIFSKDLAMHITDSEADRKTLGLVFGVLGTQVMDFCLDQLETPLRAFTLDVCSPYDQQRAFTIQTLFMGFGGALGFVVDGIDWENIFSYQNANIIGFQVKVVYIFAMVIYVTTATMTLLSIKEVHWKKRMHTKQPRLKLTDVSSKIKGQTVKSSSDPIVIPSLLNGTNPVNRSSKEFCKHGRSVDDRSQSGLSRACDANCHSTKRNTASDFSQASTHVNVLTDSNSKGRSEKSLPSGSRSSQKDCERNDIGFVYPAPTLHSISLFPRISMCKSVFLTMSCPEGLNDPFSTATSSSLITDDECCSSDEEHDSSLANSKLIDDDICGSSMPNLSNRNGPFSHPATFLEIIRNKIYGETSVNGQTHVPDAGTSVDDETMFPSCTNKLLNSDAMEIMHASDVSLETSEQDTNSQNVEKNGKIFGKINQKHTENGVDCNGNKSVVRSLELDSEDGAKESLVGRKDGSTVKKRKRKSKERKATEGEAKPISLRMLWLSILTMPVKLRYLCMSLLLSFMGLEVLLLWYTDIFGKVVYGGNPEAPPNSTELQLYNDGVQMGCWGLTIYAVAMMLFSVTLEHFKLLTRIPLRVVYSGGQMVTAVSAAVMFLFPTKVVILSLSWTIGITVSTSLTIPYVLVGKYHQDKDYVMKSPGSTKRGYGTDCAILACQMYAGNLLYAAVSGPVIMAYGGVKIMILVASLCHAAAFVFCAFMVTYPGERTFKFCAGKARTQNNDTKI